MTPETALRLLAEWAIRSLLLAAAAAALLRIARLRGAPARLAAWTAVLCGALAMPAIFTLAPGLPVGLPGAPAAVFAPAGAVFASPAPALPPQHAGAIVFQTQFAPPAMDGAAAAPRIGWTAVLLAIWAGVAGLMLLRLCLGLWLGRRLVRQATPIGPGLGESGAVRVPVTTGVWNPTVLLPPDWRAWSEEKRTAVLAHERAHALGHDPLRQLAAALYRSICWFHPLAWWLERRLAQLAEAACDDAALRAVKDETLYAETLLDFLGRAPGRVLWQGVAMVRKGDAMRRMERILDVRYVPASAPTWRVLALLLVVAAALAYAAGAVRPVPAGAGAGVAAPLPQPVVTPAPQPAPAPALAPIPQTVVTPVPALAPAPVPAPQPAPAPILEPAVTPPPAPMPAPVLALEPASAPQPAPKPAAPAPKPAPAPKAPRGDDCIILQGDHSSSFGSSDGIDFEEARRLRRQAGQDLIWLRHAGGVYVIKDAATLRDAQSLLEDAARWLREVPRTDSSAAELRQLAEQLSQPQAAASARDAAAGRDTLEGLDQQMRQLDQDMAARSKELAELAAQLAQANRQLEAAQGQMQERMQKMQRRMEEFERRFPARIQQLLDQAIRAGKAERIH